MTQMWINMGPQHPMTHGLWGLRVLVDGETIIDAEVELGYLHRSVEKIAERRRWFQNTTLADRLCYASAMTWSHAYVLTVEELMEVTVPPRAEYLRVATLEMQRIASHLMWLAAYLPDLGLLTGFLYAMREREMFLNLLETLSGSRLLYNYMLIGGVKRDIPPGFRAKTERVLKLFERRLDDYEMLFDASKIYRMRTEGVGVIAGDDAVNWGITGPNLRGSGVPFDVRRDDPYSVYPELDWEVQTEQEGDCFARYRVRMNEMQESCNLIRQALDRLPEGPVRAKHVLLHAEGTAFRRTEDSRGEALMYVVGDGSQHPYRWKIRSPVFTTVSAAPHYLRGYKLADVPAIMGSVDMCIGETDK